MFASSGETTSGGVEGASVVIEDVSPASFGDAGDVPAHAARNGSAATSASSALRAGGDCGTARPMEDIGDRLAAGLCQREEERINPGRRTVRYRARRSVRPPCPI